MIDATSLGQCWARVGLGYLHGGDSLELTIHIEEHIYAPAYKRG